MSVSLITLKHLSREFDIDPYKLRIILRAKFTSAPNKRWKWDTDDIQLAAVRNYLTSLTPPEAKQ